MRTLPHNIEAEQAVIGAMILSKIACDEALSSLSSDDFYAQHHMIIFDVINNLINDRVAIDLTTITSKLVDLNKLVEIGGVDYLRVITQSVFTASNINYYIDIVLEKSLLRRLIFTSESIAAKGYEANENTNNLIQEAEKSILEVTRNTRVAEFKLSKDLVVEIKENITELSKQKDGLTGTPSGFKEIDRITNGFQGGDLIIIAARPAVGKTAFALNIASNAALLAKKPVAIFSLEMGADQLVKRMLSASGRIE
ncbi:MAG: replicative DNA helicase, partial [Bacilli bacterium]